MIEISETYLPVFKQRYLKIFNCNFITAYKTSRLKAGILFYDLATVF